LLCHSAREGESRAWISELALLGCGLGCGRLAFVLSRYPAERTHLGVSPPVLGDLRSSSAFSVLGRDKVCDRRRRFWCQRGGDDRWANTTPRVLKGQVPLVGRSRRRHWPNWRRHSKPWDCRRPPVLEVPRGVFGDCRLLSREQLQGGKAEVLREVWVHVIFLGERGGAGESVAEESRCERRESEPQVGVAEAGELCQAMLSGIQSSEVGANGRLELAEKFSNRGTCAGPPDREEDLGAMVFPLDA
jgi:hypothetical protein